MGLTPGLPRRRSMEDRSSSRTRRSIFAGAGGASEPETLDPDDFADVFGGPPRSLLAHKLSRSSSFYEEIFRPPEFASPAPAKGGRSLPVFRIPAKSEAFYSDIFGSDDDRRSRERSESQSMAKSKSNSSSALSSEGLSPLRPAIGDDVALSAFASKLRFVKTEIMRSQQSVICELTIMPFVVSDICRCTLAMAIGNGIRKWLGREEKVLYLSYHKAEFMLRYLGLDGI